MISRGERLENKAFHPFYTIWLMVLFSDGFRNVDSSHPLGGRGGLEDTILTDSGTNGSVQCIFPEDSSVFEY